MNLKYISFSALLVAGLFSYNSAMEMKKLKRKFGNLSLSNKKSKPTLPSEEKGDGQTALDLAKLKTSLEKEKFADTLIFCASTATSNIKNGDKAILAERKNSGNIVDRQLPHLQWRHGPKTTLYAYIREKIEAEKKVEEKI